METVVAFLVAVLSGLGLHLMLSRGFVRIVLGIGLVSNAVNLLIFSAAGMMRGRSSFVPPDAERPAEMADPLPQALVLTALVITFAIQAFALVLVYRVYQVTGTDDPDALVASEGHPAQDAERATDDRQEGAP